MFTPPILTFIKLDLSVFYWDFVPYPRYKWRVKGNLRKNANFYYVKIV